MERAFWWMLRNENFIWLLQGGLPHPFSWKVSKFNWMFSIYDIALVVNPFYLPQKCNQAHESGIENLQSISIQLRTSKAIRNANHANRFFSLKESVTGSLFFHPRSVDLPFAQLKNFWFINFHFLFNQTFSCRSMMPDFPFTSHRL